MARASKILTLADMSREIFLSGDLLEPLWSWKDKSKFVSRSPVRLRERFFLFSSILLVSPSLSSSLLTLIMADVLFLPKVLAGMGGLIFSSEDSGPTEESKTNRV